VKKNIRHHEERRKAKSNDIYALVRDNIAPFDKV